MKARFIVIVADDIVSFKREITKHNLIHDKVIDLERDTVFDKKENRWVDIDVY